MIDPLILALVLLWIAVWVGLYCGASMRDEHELADCITDYLQGAYPGVDFRKGSDRLSRPMIEVRVDGEWRFTVRVEQSMTGQRSNIEG